MFDQNFQAVDRAGTFTDPNLPAGYAPFGIQSINGNLYVTYAKQDAAKYDDVAGVGNGFLDVFNGDGMLQERLVSQGPLNSPWGLALAPAGFGEFSQDLLVGNFGDGHINVFEPSSGRFLGPLDDTQGNPITIDHLWGLEFGNGAGAGNTNTLFFNAGIDNQEHGLFGKLDSTGSIAGDAENSDGPSGNIYGAVPDTLPGNTSVAVPAVQGDNYPLPPAAGPALRGDIEAAPRALPVPFPLRATSADLAPALLTVSEGAQGSPGTATPRALAVANTSGNESNVTGAASSPGGSLSGSLAANSSAGQNDVLSMNGPSALDILLSLRTEPDLTERMTPASEPPMGEKSSLPDVASLGVNAEIQYPSLQEDNPVTVLVRIDAAIQNRDDPTPNQRTRAAVVNQEDGSEQTTKSAGHRMPERKNADHETALETTDLLTILLVAGGTCLMLGVGQATRRASRLEYSYTSPIVHRV